MMKMHSDWCGNSKPHPPEDRSPCCSGQQGVKATQFGEELPEAVDVAQQLTEEGQCLLRGRGEGVERRGVRRG